MGAAGRDGGNSAAAQLASADLQIHSSLSDGTASPAAIVRYASEQTDLDLIAITDHDDFRGAEAAREAAAGTNARVEVVPGIELTTRSGHLLALWIDGPIAPFQSLERTLESIQRAGGLAVVPHPLGLLTLSLGTRSIERALRSEASRAVLVGLELANPTPAARQRQASARRANRDWHLAETGGSDAHFLEFIGSARTVFARGAPADASGALRAALLARTTVAEQRAAPSLREIGPRRLLAQQWHGLSATPRIAVAGSVAGPLAARAARGWRSARQRAHATVAGRL